MIENISKALACECEKALIEKYKSNVSSYGYNLAKGGNGGATVWGSRHPISKHVYQYDFEGNFINEWVNAQEASKELDICVSDIHANCRNKVQKAGYFQWSYTKHDYIEPYIRRAPKYKSDAPIYQFSSDWKLLNIYKNVSYIDSQNFDKEKITNCCSGKSLTHKNYFWIYENNLNPDYINKIKYLMANKHNQEKQRKPVYQYNRDKVLLKKYDSVYEVENALKIKAGTIQHACKASKTHYAKGFYWYYLEIN